MLLSSCFVDGISNHWEAACKTLDFIFLYLLHFSVSRLCISINVSVVNVIY